MTLSFLIALKVLVLALWVSSSARAALARARRAGTHSGITGAEVARRILHTAGARSTTVAACPGRWADHYDPQVGAVVLSAKAVYQGKSVAAAALAAHEAGHALQHLAHDPKLRLAWTIEPIRKSAACLILPALAFGLFIGAGVALLPAAVLYLFCILCGCLTVACEEDASERGLAALARLRLLAPRELQLARETLSQTASTYAAAAFTAPLEVIDAVFAQYRTKRAATSVL